MAHKKVKSKTPKHRTPKHRTKISQKVIQKVIVKIGEERKAKKARRRHRRTNKAMEQEFMQQQAIQEKVSPIVVYQTGPPFQAPKPSPSIIETAMEVKQKPSYVITEQDVEPLFKPKEELLATFINPVASAKSNEPINSEVYTKQVFPQEKVEGNYAFGFEDIYTDKPPSALYNSEFGINPQQVHEENMNITQEETGYETGYESSAKPKPKRTYRSRQQIQNEREQKLQSLLELGGIAPEKAFRLAKEIHPIDLEEKIRLQKLVLKGRKIKIPK